MKRYIIIAGLISTLVLVGCGEAVEDDMLKDDVIDEYDNVEGYLKDEDNYLKEDYDIYDGMNINYADGTYRAEASEYDGLYKHYVEITIKDNKIDKVMYDGFDETGKLKSQDDDLIKSYTDEFKTSPKDMMDMYANKLKDSQMIDDVKAMIGGEDEHKYFDVLAREALNKATKGDESVSYVDLHL